MEQPYREFERKIKGKHSLAWTPSFEETIRTTAKRSLIVAIIARTFEKLDWDVVHKDADMVEAKRKNKHAWTEKITVRVLDENSISIRSVSLGNEFWDLGRNYKRVKLFQHVFDETARSFSGHEEAAKLEAEIRAADNWDHYVEPETLPPPRLHKEPVLAWPLLTGVAGALLCAATMAWIQVSGFYFIGLMDALVGLLFGWFLALGVRSGNYTDFPRLRIVFIGMIAVFFVCDNFFQYQILRSQEDLPAIGFLEFLKLRIEAGLQFRSTDVGSVGLIISWIFQLAIIYWVGIVRVVSVLTSWQIEKVPPEVIEFVLYHMVKGRQENEIRHALFEKGWKREEDQRVVFEGLGAIGNKQQMARME